MPNELGSIWTYFYFAKIQNQLRPYGPIFKCNGLFTLVKATLGKKVLLHHISLSTVETKTKNIFYVDILLPGVIFALKVITTYMLPSGMHYVMGMFPVPSWFAVWAELGIIQLLVPNASFLGTHYTWFPPGLENLGKREGIFKSGKSQGILLRLEKPKIILKINRKNYTGKLEKILEKSGKFVSQ